MEEGGSKPLRACNCNPFLICDFHRLRLIGQPATQTMFYLSARAFQPFAPFATCAKLGLRFFRAPHLQLLMPTFALNIYSPRPHKHQQLAAFVTLACCELHVLGCLSDRSTAVNLAVTAQKLSARVAERAKPNEATSGVG